VKRIIFSIFTDKLNKHTSVSDYKQQQFLKYKDRIIAAHKSYAKLCNADYELLTSIETNYDELQFNKLIKLEELSNIYDEIVYIDFDIVPQNNKSIFDSFDLNHICAYSIPSPIPYDKLRFRMQDDNWHKMDMYTKTCAKNAMLLLDDINGTDNCINTGVVAANKKSIEALRFHENLTHCKNQLDMAIADNLYPKEIHKRWTYNNEVFVSYLIERYNIPYINIGIQWNFILDHISPQPSAAAYLIHHVNKEFELSFNA